MPQNRALYGALNQMGQVPLEPPNVKGWPGGRMWINTSTLFARYNTAVLLAAGAKASSKSDPDGTVDYWLSRLIQRPVETDKKKVLLQALGNNANETSLRKVVQLIVSMPEYQLC